MSVGFTLAELKQCFELRMVHMIMTADEVVRDEELLWLERVFEPDELAASGFLDPRDNRFTQRFAEAVAAAPEQLAGWLGDDEKLCMLDLLFKACEADGEVHPREVSVVVQAGRLLGVGQEALVEHVARLMGDREVLRLRAGMQRRDPVADEMSETATAILALTQDQVLRAVAGATGEEADVLRQRIDAVVDNPGGMLTLVASPSDVRTHRIDGAQDLIGWLVERGSLVAMAGRLGVAFDGRPDDKRDLAEVPEIREFLFELVTIYPWLPVWMDPYDGSAGELLATRVAGDVRSSAHLTHFLAEVVRAANYAVALSQRLGTGSLDHVYAYLAQFGMTDIPPGYFQGVEVLVDELDPWARKTQAPRG